MSAPTLQQVNLVNQAIKVAKASRDSLADLAGFLANQGLSPNAPGIPTANWSDPTTPGPLAGFNPEDYTNFITQSSSLITALQANSGAIGQAFAALAERAGN